jgi:hypothetical protein
MLCTVEDVQARAHAELSDWDEAHIESVIEAVGAKIEAETHREFEVGTSETRTFEALRDGFVSINDAVTVTAVTYQTNADTTPVTSTAYRSRRNPIMSIAHLDYGEWAEADLVNVTGTFGYAASVPYDIWDIAVAWTLRTLKAADAAYQDATAIPEMGQLVYSKAIPADVRRVLDRYRRVTPVMRIS